MPTTKEKLEFYTELDAVLEWLNQYATSSLMGFSPGNTTIKDGFVNVKGDVYFHQTCDFEHFKVRFGKVTGCFNCDKCTKLKSLEGAPRQVGLDFSCHGATNLRTLQGAPATIGGYFSCGMSPHLKDLNGGPKKVSGDYLCLNLNITTIAGVANSIGDRLYLADCPLLSGIKNIPTICSRLQITNCPSIDYLVTTPNLFIAMDTPPKKPSAAALRSLIQHSVEIKCPRKNLPAWLNMVNGYAQSGDLLHTIQLFEKYCKEPFLVAEKETPMPELGVLVL